MKEMFEKPVLEVIEFDPEDIITSSGCAPYCNDCKLHQCTSDNQSSPSSDTVLG